MPGASLRVCIQRVAAPRRRLSSGTLEGHRGSESRPRARRPGPNVPAIVSPTVVAADLHWAVSPSRWPRPADLRTPNQIASACRPSPQAPCESTQSTLAGEGSRLPPLRLTSDLTQRACAPLSCQQSCQTESIRISPKVPDPQPEARSGPGRRRCQNVPGRPPPQRGSAYQPRVQPWVC